jgi:hypothetical protein
MLGQVDLQYSISKKESREHFSIDEDAMAWK